jgi:peptidoglycan DL-endopeptidase CwlO
MKKTLVGMAALAAAGLGAAGCSTSSSSPTTTQAARTTTTAAASSGTTTTATGVSAGGGATPTEVGQAFVTAVQSGAGSAFCTTYAEAGQTSSCQSAFGELTSEHVTFKNLALGKVVTEGSRAIVNITGSVCAGSDCQTVTDPNAAMAKGRSFEKAYAEAADPNSSDSSSFASAVTEVNGRWFATGF